MGKECGLRGIRPLRLRCVTSLVVVFLGPISDLLQGKTFFLSYLLILRLLEGLPTVYQIPDEACYLFSNPGKGVKLDVESLFGPSYDERRVFRNLTDEALKNVQWKSSSSPWFILLAASPKMIEASREWAKERSPRKYFMRNWRWGEIVAGYR